MVLVSATKAVVVHKLQKKKQENQVGTLSKVVTSEYNTM